METGGQSHAPAALPPGRHTTHYGEGWMHPRASLVWKILLPPGSNPQTVQPVASRYTDYAILTHAIYISIYKTLTD
jgi:hypothetical protein